MLNSKNSKIINVPADGNCLFHAIVCCTQYIQPNVRFTHLTLRHQVVQHMRRHTSVEQKKNILQEYSFNHVNQYFAHMKKAGTWGDEFVIEALSEMLQRTINVYNTHFDILSTYVPKSNTNNSAKQSLHIMWDSTHFNALRVHHNTSNKTIKQNRHTRHVSDRRPRRTSLRKRDNVNYAQFY